MFNFLTIKIRILLTFALLSSIAIYYFSNWVSDSSRRHYLESAEELLVDHLIMVKKMILANTDSNADLPDISALAAVYSATDEKHPVANIYEVSKDSSDMYAYLTDREGKVIYHSKNPELTGQPYAKWRNVFFALSNSYGARSTRDDKDDPTTSHLHVSHPLFIDRRLIGTVTLVKPVKRISLFLELSRNRVTRIAAGTLVLILLSGFLLMRRIVNPIEDLTKYTEKISRGERPSLPKLPRGELTLLGKTIEETTRNLDGKDYIESYIQGLTHELKSPIAAIKGASELIEAGKLSEEELKLFNNINRESDRMAEMVQKLLLLSRIENQNFSENLEPVDLKKLIEELIDETRERYPERQFDFHAAESIKMTGDRLLLKTALNNLIANACDFSEKKIEVLLKKMPEIRIEVKDEGKGIPEYAQDQIFNKFYSLPRPDSGAKSSGLGLAIVQEIVQLHGGTVQILNRDDVQTGVVARIKFPH